MSAAASLPRYHLYGETEGASEFDFFHIETIRARSLALGWQLELHAHQHLAQILHISKGGGRLIEADGEREIRAGGIAFTPPGVLHGWSFSPETEGYVVSFTPDYLVAGGESRSDAERAALTSAGNTLLHPQGHETRLSFYFGEMAREFDEGARRRAFFRPLVALSLLIVFPGEVAGSADRTPGFSLFRFRQLVEDMFRGGQGAEAYAAEMGLTVQRLNRYCRLFTGRTVAQNVRDRLILEAKRLLAFSGLSVSQVAYDLGFEDPAYFSRVFRKETGEAPADFRARHTGGGAPDSTLSEAARQDPPQ